MSGEFEVQGTLTINASGNGRVRFEGPSGGDWFIGRAVFARTGVPNNEEVSVYVGSVDNAGVRDSTIASTFPAVSDNAFPIRVPLSTPFFGAVSGGNSGDVWTVTMSIRAADAQAEAAEDWAGYGAPDSLLIEPGFPNQQRQPTGRR